MNSPFVQRVLVVKLGAFGDLVLADGALRDIRAQHPQAHITLLTRRNFARLMQRCTWVDAVLSDDNAPRWRVDRMLALRTRLVQGRFDCVYDLQNSQRTRFYRRWLAPPRQRWSQLSRHAPKQGSVPARHAQQLQSAGVVVRDCLQPAPTWIANDARALLRDAGIDGAFVALLPGSSARHPHKRWPHYAACSHQLQALGLQVVTIPGIDEAALGAGFAGSVLRYPDGRVLDLHDLAGVLQAAACVVGNDSGPTHLAACLGAPCVALFESDSPARISTDIEARGALMASAQPLAAVPVETVVAAVRAQLASGDESRDPGLNRLPA